MSENYGPVEKCTREILDMMTRSGQFEERPGQFDMAVTIASAIDVQTTKLSKASIDIEAPTGTGKSFALLVNAFSAWRMKKLRTVISTQTHVLQNQMVLKDVLSISRFLHENDFSQPDIRVEGRRSKTPGKKIRPAERSNIWTASIVNGRSNYICMRKYEHLLSMGNGGDILINIPSEDGTREKSHIVDQSRLQPLRALHNFSTDETLFSEDDPLLLFISADRRSCLGKQCPYQSTKCLFYRALRNTNPLMVTNHALLTAFLSGQEIMPESDNGNVSETPVETSGLLTANLYFWDEAHHLMGYRTAGQTVFDIRDGDVRRLLLCPSPVENLDKFSMQADIRKNFHEWFKRTRELVGNGRFFDASGKIHLDAGEDILLKWKSSIDKFHGIHKRVASEDFSYAESIFKEITSFRAYRDDAASGKISIDVGDGIKASVTEERRLSEDMAKKLKKMNLAVFSSGTLFTGESSDGVFKAETGVRTDFPSLRVPSPFTYDNVIFWVPAGACPVRSPRESANGEAKFTRYILDFCKRYVPPYVRANLGGVLILCSSLRNMKWISRILTSVIPEKMILTQGAMSKKKLATSFLKNESSVLVASASFREGFDAPGKKLTWVIIDRLPFGYRDDQKQKRNLEKLSELGLIENPFKHSINLMKFALVQSFGRLVRKESDWGTVTVLDPRLWYRGKDWGIDDCIPVKREHWYCDDPGETEWMQRAMSIIPKGGKSDRTGNIFEE